MNSHMTPEGQEQRDDLMSSFTLPTPKLNYPQVQAFIRTSTKEHNQRSTRKQNARQTIKNIQIITTQSIPAACTYTCMGVCVCVIQ